MDDASLPTRDGGNVSPQRPILVLVKGPAQPGIVPGIPEDRAGPLLRSRLRTLRGAWPGCDVRYVLGFPDDPARAWAEESGHGIIVRPGVSFARDLRRAASEAWAVAVVPSTNLFLVPQILEEGTLHLNRGFDAVLFENASLGIAPEILLRPGLLAAMSDEDLSGAFFARVRERNPAMSVVEHAYAHADLLRKLLGSLRAESGADLARVDEAMARLGLEDFTPEAFGRTVEAEHARCSALMARALGTAGPDGGKTDLSALNERLALLEYHRGSEVLSSFPVEVCLNLTDACNAKCVFCGYHGQRPSGETLRLEDLDRLDWLRFVRMLMLHGGYGEPLLHPLFPEVVRRLKHRFPGLKIGSPTNASCLDGEKLDAAVECLDLVRVSLNAATPETHARLMPPLSWDVVLGNVRALVEKRARRGRGPRIGFNYVLYRDNARELPGLPALAAELGVDFISIDHCELGVSPLVDWSMSLREDPEASNAVLAETAARCRELGLECVHPPLFTKGRLTQRPDFCRQPWTHLFVAHDRATYVCCEMDLSDVGFPGFQWLGAADFRDKVWNAQGLAKLRRSLAKGPWLPACRLCRSSDRNALGPRGLKHEETRD